MTARFDLQNISDQVVKPFYQVITCTSETSGVKGQNLQNDHHMHDSARYEMFKNNLCVS